MAPKLQLSNPQLSAPNLGDAFGSIRAAAEKAATEAQSTVSSAAGAVASGAAGLADRAARLPAQAQAALSSVEAHLPPPAQNLLGGARTCSVKVLRPALQQLEGATSAAQAAALGARVRLDSASSAMQGVAVGARARVEGAVAQAQGAALNQVERYVHPAILESLRLAPARAIIAEGEVDPALVSTMPRTLAYRAAKTPNADAFYFPDGANGWATISWQAVADRVRNISGGLHALGFQPGQSGAIVSMTSLEWVLADFAIASAGGVTAAIMPGDSPEKVAHILNDSKARVVFVENDAQLKKLESKRAELPHVQQVVNLKGSRRVEGWVIGPEHLEALGKDWNLAHPGAQEKVAQAVKPEDLATLIYTSGTTGTPKGVELRHSVWSAQQEAAASLGVLSGSDKQYLWLPLAHSFGKFLLSASVRLGIPTAIDGDPNHIAEGLKTTHPTFTSAVPRVYEKIYAGISAKASQNTGLKKDIYDWAVGVGRAMSKKQRAGEKPDLLLATQYALADALVFSKIKAHFGGQLRFGLSGGAPLSREIGEALHGLGINILEGYGLTETAGASHVNLPWNFAFGTVGPALPGVEVRISDAPESRGEIQLRGAGVMSGYHNLSEETKKTFTEDGWFKTGDVGHLDDKGRLVITDRIKNIFKLSIGEYVAPAPVELGIKAAGQGLVSQVLVHGYNRKYCTAIITLDDARLKALASGGVEPDRDPKVREAVQAIVDQVNQGLKGPFKVVNFFIPPADFTVESGELTQTQKVVRKVVEEKYAAQLDALYSEA